ncbi:Oidioi.mRNA.OKI2018_I69.chr1.g3046.t1.cds [Oikopleura dioica]|uniref:Oidioi.mRNA.OKI2018_I69.chr1.g3046.t1.cds n=1 Tax=Oikopleura dioica TaxID=34765 RepID=A0ABN7T252_OIKDI|nr:Oidioi.mRNA.OKI2018_I69.chr1.g3046.t1.cds [Oikopleura dioica]
MKLKQRLALATFCGIVFFVIKPLIEPEEGEWHPRHRRHHRLVHRADYDSLADRKSQGFAGSQLHGPNFERHKNAIREYHMENGGGEDQLLRREHPVAPANPVIPAAPVAPVAQEPVPFVQQQPPKPVEPVAPVAPQVPLASVAPAAPVVPAQEQQPAAIAPVVPQIPQEPVAPKQEISAVSVDSSDKNFPSLKIESNVDQDAIDSEISRIVLNSEKPAMKTNAWEVARNWIRPRLIYPQNHPQLGWILNHAATVKIKKADILPKGTQLKMLVYLEGNQKAVFKPKRYERDFQVPGKAWNGYDRHNAEIASFHLDRILNFRRAPLVTGRVVDFTEEIKPVAAERLSNTFKEVEGKSCFYGVCYYCNENEYACADENGKLEGSLTLWFPEDKKLEKIRHPYQRTYNDEKQAKWETDEEYCNKYVKKIEPYNKGPRLLDIMDTSVFDFFIGNGDRHHYEIFKDTPDAMLLLLDNANAAPPMLPIATVYIRPLGVFAKWTFDEVSGRGDENDPIAPVLHKSHIEAINRRMPIIFQTIQSCVNKHGKENVIMEVWKGQE